MTFWAQISTLSYVVKNFKWKFLKKPSPKKFETQDLKWSLSTCKKLLKHFFWDIFLFQGISEDTVVLIRDQMRIVAKQVSVAVGWVKIKISLMAQLKGLTAKFKLM